MSETAMRAAELVAEKGSFYAEFTAIIGATLLSAVLVILLRRLRKSGFSRLFLVFIGTLGFFTVYVLSGIVAYFVFDRVYVPFILNPPFYVAPSSFGLVWVHSDISKLAIIISILCSAVVFFFLSRNNQRDGANA